MAVTTSEFVHLARFAMATDLHNAAALLRRVQRRIGDTEPRLAGEIATILESGGGGAPTRGRPTAAVPVDMDSRLHLVRVDEPPEHELRATWLGDVAEALRSFVVQREREDELRAAGLAPPRSMLFSGPPGVGKTLAARWVSQRLQRTLLTLDLAAVMSSLLGKTGNNLRSVLDYARRRPCVLLMDEFDAIAKRRDDLVEVGELKRLVTVLLQSIDDWPSDGVLIAATNHPELLDPAVWRRFDTVVEFPLPSRAAVSAFVQSSLEGHSEGLTPVWSAVLASHFDGMSFADIERSLLSMRRQAVIEARALRLVIQERATRWVQELPQPERRMLAAHLLEDGYSQRQVTKITRIARDTLRKDREKGAAG